MYQQFKVKKNTYESSKYVKVHFLEDKKNLGGKS